MPPFPKPGFTYNYRVDAQLEALRRYRDTKPGRAIPRKAPNRLLLCTWTGVWSDESVPPGRS